MEFVDWEIKVIYALENLIECPTSDAQGIIEGQEMQHPNLMLDAYEKGTSPEEMAKIIDKMASVSDNPRQSYVYNPVNYSLEWDNGAYHFIDDVMLDRDYGYEQYLNIEWRDLPNEVKDEFIIWYDKHKVGGSLALHEKYGQENPRYKLIRVSYGIKDMPPEMREYKVQLPESKDMLGTGAVGTLSEIKEWFMKNMGYVPEFDIVDKISENPLYTALINAWIKADTEDDAVDKFWDFTRKVNGINGMSVGNPKIIGVEEFENPSENPTTLCECGHYPSQHHETETSGKTKICDYSGYSCNCTGYHRAKEDSQGYPIIKKPSSELMKKMGFADNVSENPIEWSTEALGLLLDNYSTCPYTGNISEEGYIQIKQDAEDSAIEHGHKEVLPGDLKSVAYIRGAENPLDISSLTGPTLKRLTGAIRAKKRYENKHVDGSGNFGFYIRMPDGRPYDVDGDYDITGKISGIQINALWFPERDENKEKENINKIQQAMKKLDISVMNWGRTVTVENPNELQMTRQNVVENLLRDMFFASNKKIPAKTINSILLGTSKIGREWKRYYGTTIVRKAWNGLKKENFVYKEKDNWFWGYRPKPKKWLEDIEKLKEISVNAKMSPYLADAVNEIIIALENGNLARAGDLSVVKSYICGGYGKEGYSEEKCPFAEDDDYNTQIISTTLYSYLDSLNFELAMTTETMPAGMIALSASGSKERKIQEKSYESPTLNRIAEESRRSRASVFRVTKVPEWAAQHGVQKGDEMAYVDGSLHNLRLHSNFNLGASSVEFVEYRKMHHPWS